MVNTSVVFDSEINERSLDRTVDKVDSRLQETGQIDVDAATGGMGLDTGPGMGGGADMDAFGEMNDGIGGLQDSFDDSMPAAIPAAGGIASKALPIAIAGGIGAGLLTQMSAASGRLQATLGMFGTAMDLFFKPFGDFLGATFRPMAKDLISFAQDFNEIADSEGLSVAVTSMGQDIITSIAGQIGESAVNLATGKWDAKDIITLTASTWAAAKIISIGASVWGAGSLMSITAGSWGAGSLIGLAGMATFKAGAIIALTGTITYGVGELIEIARGGEGVEAAREAGQDFAEDSPGIANAIETAFTSDANPFFFAGKTAGSLARGEGIPTPDFARNVVENRQSADEVADAGSPMGVTPEGLRTVTEQNTGGGEVTGPESSQDILDALHGLRDDIQSLGIDAQISIGEERFAELVQEAQENTQTGRDPLQSP
jgi:hypothetical protein